MTKARSNATANAAKGDLTVGNGTNLSGVLAVGNSGDTIVADSSTATGLRYQGSQAAAKNAVINGGMDIWQRGTSSASQGYVTADRWYMTGASTTFSQETSDLPTGFRYALKCTMSGTAQPQPILTIETQDSIRFAGQTVVLSYYVKTSNSTNAVIRLDYSNNVDEAVTGTYTTISTNSASTTTSWTRVSSTFAVPSTAKTLRVVVGANGNLTTGQTILISGVQLELGSVLTTFTRAGGTIQGELAACQRYYFKDTKTVLRADQTLANSTVYGVYYLPQEMRTTPTLTQTGGATETSNTSATTLSNDGSSSNARKTGIYVTGGASTGTVYMYRTVEWSAEL